MFEVYKLHLKELLRNRNLIITTILIPILLYPMLYWGVTQFFAIKAGFSDNQKIDISVNYEGDKFLSFNDSLKTIDNINLVPVKQKEDNNLTINIGELYGLPHYTIDIDSTNSIQVEFFGKIEKKLKSYYTTQLKNKVDSSAKPEEYYQVFELRDKNIADKNEIMTKLLAMLVPMFAIMSILAGASTSAVEITAGEKENKVTETLFVTPLNRRKILLAKILVSVTFAFVSGIINFFVLGAVMVQAFQFFFAMLGKISGMTFDPGSFFTFHIIFVILLSVLLVSILGSVIFISIASFAKNKKEANVMISPAMSLLMFSSYIIIIPAIEPDFLISMIPVLNIAFALKSIIANNYQYTYLLSVLGFSLLHVALVFKILLPILEDEEVILGTTNLTLFQKIKLRWKK